MPVFIHLSRRASSLVLISRLAEGRRLSWPGDSTSSGIKPRYLHTRVFAARNTDSVKVICLFVTRKCCLRDKDTLGDNPGINRRCRSGRFTVVTSATRWRHDVDSWRHRRTLTMVNFRHEAVHVASTDGGRSSKPARRRTVPFTPCTRDTCHAAADSDSIMTLDFNVVACRHWSTRDRLNPSQSRDNNSILESLGQGIPPPTAGDVMTS